MSIIKTLGAMEWSLGFLLCSSELPSSAKPRIKMIHAKKTLLKVLDEPMALSVMKSGGELQKSWNKFDNRQSVVKE
jgi:hypothetical protein